MLWRSVVSDGFNPPSLIRGIRDPGSGIRTSARQQGAGDEIRHQPRRFEKCVWPRDDPDAPRSDGLANRLRVWFGINDRIRHSKLLETMHIAVAHHRLAVATRPPFGAHVE